jgi:hypothetical protein
VRLAALVIPLVGAVLGIVNQVAPWIGLDMDDHDPDPTQPPSATSRPPKPGEHNTAGVGTSGRPAIGTCLDEDYEPINCGYPHLYQVASTATEDCDTDALEFLGGRPDFDALLVGAVDRGPSHPEVCMLKAPDGVLETGSWEGSLSTSAGDRWRRCRSDRAARDVPCTTQHDGEYVPVAAAGDTPASDDICHRAAEAYMEASLRTLGDRLSVATTPEHDTVWCVISARGLNVLTGSLRSIGTNALPLAPRASGS